MSVPRVAGCSLVGMCVCPQGRLRYFKSRMKLCGHLSWATFCCTSSPCSEQYRFSPATSSDLAMVISLAWLWVAIFFSSCMRWEFPCPRKLAKAFGNCSFGLHNHHMLFHSAIAVAQKSLSYTLSSRLVPLLQTLKLFANERDNLLSDLHTDPCFFHRNLLVPEIELLLE